MRQAHDAILVLDSAQNMSEVEKSVCPACVCLPDVLNNSAPTSFQNFPMPNLEKLQLKISYFTKLDEKHLKLLLN